MSVDVIGNRVVHREGFASQSNLAVLFVGIGGGVACWSLFNDVNFVQLKYLPMTLSPNSGVSLF